MLLGSTFGASSFSGRIARDGMDNVFISNKVVFPNGPSQDNCPFIGKLPHFDMVGASPLAQASKRALAVCGVKFS